MSKKKIKKWDKRDQQDEKYFRWKEQKYEWARYRWEFMRRNPEYKKDYQETLELQEKAKYPPDYKDEHNLYPYYLTPEYEKVKEICVKWGIYHTHLPDPNESHEDLILIEHDDMNPEDSQKLRRHAFVHFFEQRAVSIVYETQPLIADKSGKHPPVTEGYDLVIHIDFKKVNSLNSLKTEIFSLLDE